MPETDSWHREQKGWERAMHTAVLRPGSLDKQLPGSLHATGAREATKARNHSRRPLELRKREE